MSVVASDNAGGEDVSVSDSSPREAGVLSTSLVGVESTDTEVLAGDDPGVLIGTTNSAGGCTWSTEITMLNI